MTASHPTPGIADEIPWSNRMTEYDDRHFETYLRLLDADTEGLSKDDMARGILGIDSGAEPQRARKALESHLARARWMTTVGYRYLLAGDYPGAERRMAEDLEFLRPLGIPVVPRARSTGR